MTPKTSYSGYQGAKTLFVVVLILGDLEQLGNDKKKKH